MTTLQPAHEPALTFDFRPTLQANRLKGLWQMMSDYRLSYIAATIALAISALSKTYTYILLRFFADDVLGQKKYIGDTLTSSLIWIGLGFIGLAAFEGTFSFLSGRLAAYTAEGITRRLVT
jgi:ATP-binding cassette subfamily B protein